MENYLERNWATYNPLDWLLIFQMRKKTQMNKKNYAFIRNSKNNTKIRNRITSGLTYPDIKPQIFFIIKKPQCTKKYTSDVVLPLNSHKIKINTRWRKEIIEKELELKAWLKSSTVRTCKPCSSAWYLLSPSRRSTSTYLSNEA